MKKSGQNFKRRTNCFLLLISIVLVLFLVPNRSEADVRLPSVFSSGMVLQRDREIPVWGWAESGEEITVELAGQEQKAVADDNGNWRVTFSPLDPVGELKLVVRGTHTITLTDILLGDVWICSGQSNMQMMVKEAANATEEIAAANYPEIRILTVATTSKKFEQTDVEVQPWTAVTPKTIPNFSAVAYYFGRAVQQETDVPIGLIHTSWGASSCEAWMSEKTIQSYAGLHSLLDPAFLEKLIPQKKACHLYNGMLHPLIPFAIRGAIWYQGESNATRAPQHEQLFPLLIQNWREEWGQGDFPFYYVQLANFKQREAEPGESDWAELRETQDRTLSVPRTGQAITIDIGDANDIHPKNKQEVGRRLALLALKDEYGHSDVIASGPRFHSLTIEGNQVTVHFDETAEGLEIHSEEDPPVLHGFALAGADRRFYWATATLEGNSVVLTAPEVERPVAVRYNWAINPDGNLFNSAGLPACPFRSDRWPRIGER